MSHNKERTEKVCLNCNTPLYGRYCHVCGQENIEPKESFWHLVHHFFGDITHFDGKFFSSTATLIARPGLLPREYMLGKRARYLNPIRMYVFSSALFFLVFFSLYNAENWHIDNKGSIVAGGQRLAAEKDSLQTGLEKAWQPALAGGDNAKDSAAADRQFRSLEDPGGSAPGTAHKAGDRKEPSSGSFFLEVDYSSVAAYDSVQRALPARQKDGWVKRLIKHRSIDLGHRYKDKPGDFLKDMSAKFMHSFPYLLFLSLPLYALFLKLLYIRQKKFYYVDHGIFLIYLYIFTFLFLLVYFGVQTLRQSLHWDWLGFVETGLYLYGLYYAFRAMRKFYEQKTGKTLLKFILLNMMSGISLVFLFAFFLLISVFRL